MKSALPFKSISFSSYQFVNDPVMILVEIAGITIRIRTKSFAILESLKAHYKKFISKNSNFSLNFDVYLSPTIHFDNPDGSDNFFNEQIFQNNKCTVFSNYFTGFIDINNNYGKLVCNEFDPQSLLEHFLRIAYAICALQKGVLLFHAAAVVKKGMGYVFFGPSGTGKSTVAKLSDQCLTLGDDLIVIKKVNNRFRVYATPLNVDNNWLQITNSNTAISGMYRLKKHKTNFISTISQAQALAELMSCIPSINKNLKGSSSAFDICTQIIKQIPCYELFFTRDTKFWRLIHGNFSQLPSKI